METFVAATAPKDGKGNHGYNRTCAKCKVLLRASWTGTKTMPNPDSVTWCRPCYEAKHGAMKGARQ